MLFLFLLITFISVFLFFKNLENNFALEIEKNLKNHISELSYNLSKNLKTKNDILSYRAIFDRTAANYSFISYIMIFNDDKLLLTTDPSQTSILKNPIDIEKKDSYSKLLERQYIEDEIRFYEGKNLKKLRLIYVLEKEELYSYFVKHQREFFLYFGLFPIIIFFILLKLLKIYILNPLEKLREYAYYNNIIPKAFKLKELEAIRRSLVDTLSRLDDEKKELYLMARRDSLSGLANRNALNEHLERLIHISKREKKEFAFLFLDIDHFKSINDSLGHNIGDELLKNMSNLIQNTLRPSDFVARVGGDEFVIIIQDYNNYLELSNIVHRIQKYISKPWTIKTNPINISCSIGVAFYPKDGNDVISLMKNADIAMYEAKKLGRNQYHFFTEELNKTVQESITLDKNMRKALKNNEYELYYQPKIDLQTSQIIGVEALIRWISPTKGLIPPDVFIPLAEENGFIVELGKWITNEAIEQYVRWKEKGIDINISINVSAKQLSNIKFVNQVIDKIKENNITPNKIDIEITEYMFIQDSQNTFNNLNTLHNFGVSISLDDFGTGYSSLSYLKKFPIDYLKIDKAFLDDYNSKDGSVFLETIVKLGQMLNIRVIAEGVEKEEQLKYLKSISCNQAQGYYFSKPLDIKDFESFFRNNSSK